MAAGSEVPQKGVLQASGYTPVETRLDSPIQLPGTGELWANVGKTAMNAVAQAGSMLQNSRLNPAFAAQQDYQQTQYDAAADRVDELMKTRAGRMTMGTGETGLSTVPAARTDIDPMIRMALRSAPATTPPKKTTTTTDGDGGSGGDSSAPKPKTVTEQPYEGYSASSATVGAAPPAPSSGDSTTKPETKTHTTGDELTDDRGASTDDDFLLRRMIQERGGSGAAQQGTPASMTFLNPATGNIEPLQTGPPSVFAAKSAAPAPAAPTGPPAQPPSQTPAAATQADQVAMAQWQAQNAHPVMSSQDALGWMKNQTTLAQDATYLPMGGPGGAPAFAFHMKGGGQNIVPVSQMVQKGAGPLVAAQNTSQVLSTTDQQQGGPGAQGQPPAPQDQTQVPTPPNISPPPPANIPPPAPTGPPQVAQAQPQYPHISPPAPPAAPGGYNAAAYRMPQGPTLTATGDVNPSLMAGDTGAQPVAAAPIPQVDQTDFNQNVKGYSMADLAKMKSDPVVSEDYGGFHWRQDRQDGVKYAWLTDPDSPFRELRWKAGLDQWKSTLKENGGLMQQVQAARDKVPLLHGMLSDTQIANMSEEDLKDTLAAAVRLSTTGGDASDQNSLHIRGGINQSQSVARMIQILEDAQKAGIPASEYSQLAVDQSKGAAERNAIMPNGPPKNPVDLLRRGVAQWHDWEADEGETHPLADALTKEAKYFGEQMAQTPGLEYSTGEKPENKTFTVYIGRVPIQVPIGRDTSSLQQVNRIFAGSKDPQTVIDDLKVLKSRIDTDTSDSIDRATRMNYRTPPQFKAAKEAIDNGRNIEDKTPKYTVSKPATSTTGSTAAPGATPGPTPPLQFNNEDDATKFSRNSKPGTTFDFKDSKGIIHHMRVD